MSKHPYWIKERHNPQLGVYYVAYGQMSKTAALRKAGSIYGSNRMLRFDTGAEYTAKLAALRKAREKVQ